MTQHLNTPGPSSSSSSSSLAYSLSDFTVREFLCEKQWLTMLVESPRPRLSGVLFVWMRCLISLREPQWNFAALMCFISVSQTWIFIIIVVVCVFVWRGDGMEWFLGNGSEWWGRDFLRFEFLFCSLAMSLSCLINWLFQNDCAIICGISLCIQINTNVWMYTGMSVYICLHVCTYANMYVYINICTHARTRVHTHAYRYVKTIRRGCMVFSLRVSVFFFFFSWGNS